MESGANAAPTGWRGVSLTERIDPEIVAVGEEVVVVGGRTADRAGFERTDAVSVDARTLAVTELGHLPVSERALSLSAAKVGDLIAVAVAVCVDGASASTACQSLRPEVVTFDTERSEWRTVELPSTVEPMELAGQEAVFPTVELIEVSGSETALMWLRNVDRGEFDLYALGPGADGASWAALPPPPTGDAQLCATRSGVYAMSVSYETSVGAVSGPGDAPTARVARLDRRSWQQVSSVTANQGSARPGEVPLMVCGAQGAYVASGSSGRLRLTGVDSNSLPATPERSGTDADVAFSARGGSVLASSAGELVFMERSLVTPSLNSAPLALTYDPRSFLVGALQQPAGLVDEQAASSSSVLLLTHAEKG